MLHPREAPKSTTFNHSDHLTLLWPYIPDSPPRKKRAHDRRLDPLVLCLQLPLTTISPHHLFCSLFKTYRCDASRSSETATVSARYRLPRTGPV